MIVSWQQEDARQWAGFSGDNNPIHFDEQFARSMGCKGVIVHGMRAMLDVKSALTERLLSSQPQGDFYRFSARLRKPLACGTPYRLSLADKAGGVEARLVTVDEESCCVSARLFSASAPDQTILPYDCETADLETPLLLYPGEAMSPVGRWGFLDAVLFQRMLASSTLAGEISGTDSACHPAWRVSDLFTLYSVIQTHYEVHFSASLLHPRPLRRLHYSVLPSQIIGSLPQGLVVHAVLRGWAPEGDLLLTSAATFRIRPLNQQFNQ